MHHMCGTFTCEMYYSLPGGFTSTDSKKSTQVVHRRPSIGSLDRCDCASMPAEGFAFMCACHRHVFLHSCTMYLNVVVSYSTKAHKVEELETSVADKRRVYKDTIASTQVSYDNIVTNYHTL